MTGSPITYGTELPEPLTYAALFETTGWNEMYGCQPDMLQETLLQSWWVVTAFVEEALVGTGRLVSDGVLYAVVFDMIVAPNWQGRGIGSEILRRLLQKCEAAGIRDVLLFSAHGTEPFYARHGFVARPEGAPGMILRRNPAGT